MHSTTTNTVPNLPAPAGAHKVATWDGDARYFETPRILVPIGARDVAIYTAGSQSADGRVSREICVDRVNQDNPITVSQARQIARALMAAADAVERWQTGEVTHGSH